MSAGGFLDACGFIPVSSGTGSFVVSAAITGYQTPAAAGAVNTTVYSYRAESSDKTQWEEGFGAYTVSTTTLARTTITANSSGGTSAISFSAAPNVFITALTADLQNASLLTSGTVATARLGGGTASSSTFLRGDQTYATPAAPIVPVAWAQITGSTGAMNANLGMTSCVRNSAGNYTLTMNSTRPNTNYAVVVSVEGSASVNGWGQVQNGTKTTTAFNVQAVDQVPAAFDPNSLSVVIFAAS